MADVKGMMMGGAGHDAAVIVAAMIVPGQVTVDQRDELLHAYEWWRDAILDSNERAQAAAREGDVPEDPGGVVVNLKAAGGKTIRELYETEDKVGIGSGAEYLTWIVATLGDSKPALVAAVRKFLESKTKG